ncbi:MAG TPA: hypothetical protein PL180_21670, partial [Spirochaetota bacterium]|nr:hypothetical protein [Spirochaetota bacterium]HRS79491.1 hypothetical protein [Spirochaetota bacterium]
MYREESLDSVSVPSSTAATVPVAGPDALRVMMIRFNSMRVNDKIVSPLLRFLGSRLILGVKKTINLSWD